MNELAEVLVHRQNPHHSGREANASRPYYHGRMDVGLSSPGAPASGSSSQQLFAGGWPACFLSAMKIVAGCGKVVLLANLAIDASDIATFPFTAEQLKGVI
jgi:organic hydroperoxide reductase OsmC/OhrA